MLAGAKIGALIGISSGLAGFFVAKKLRN